MRRLVPLLPLLLVALLAVSSSGPAAGLAVSADRPLPVTGYALSGLSKEVLLREAPSLTTVGVDGVTLTPDGADVPDPSPEAYKLVRRAHAVGLSTELLVSNFHGDDFDPEIGHRLLSDPEHRQAVAARLASFVGEGRFDGIAVDLESLRAEDADGLTAFVSTLRDLLPDDASMSIAVMAATTTEGYADLGYDLDALADLVDVVALMAYDQHGAGWSGPGPVGALRWQRQALSALTAVVPPEQVDLGVAGYGYTWPTTGTGGPISPRKARAVAKSGGVTPTWNADAGEWTVRLPSGTRIWWADRRSWDRRVAIAEARGLHGLALWRLGAADPLG